MSPLAGVADFDISGEKLHTPLPLGPPDILHGKLDNGLTYYVRTCTKPKARAALQLVIRVGSIVEEDHEQGIAHIVEHLAFNASEAFSNHQVVAVLESLGAPFGPCQNAHTGVEETAYELVVPTDKPEILEQALSIFNEFAFKIRCSPADLDKERGPVLEEWRAGRDASGRAQEAHWQLMLSGSRYADRLPIGQEAVIKGVDAATVRAFYERWYRPEHMAVVAVGSFEDTHAVVASIKKLLSGNSTPPRAPPPPIPQFPWAPHSEPRCRIFADKENQQTTVYMTFKSDSRAMATPADYLEFMKHQLFHIIMNSRVFKVCRQADAPFYSASFGSETLVRVCAVHQVSILPLEDRIVSAIEAIQVELARVRLYGISDRELEIAKAEYLADVEAMYLERYQGYANDLAEEYVRHFLNGELVVGEETEARLSKTLVNLITARDVQEISQQFRSTRSCVVKVVQYPAIAREEEVRAVMRQVDEREAAGDVEPWTQEDAPENLLDVLPEAGHVETSTHYPLLDATELVLSNGMRVCYKVFKALEDQVLMHGFAAGGLSQVPKEDFRTAGFSPMLAGELGMYGFKPHLLGDILAGKRVELKPSEGAFWRSVGGEQSPTDLETCLQLIYKLFTHKVDPTRHGVENELKTVLLMARQVIEATVRNPVQKFANHVRYVNYGRCYYFTPISMADLDRLDINKACEHFSRSYQNPAEFTLCFTGNIAVDDFVKLVEQYLASIPPNPEPAPLDPSELTMLPFHFPARPVTEYVKVDLIEPVAHVQVTFPVQIERANASEESFWLSLCCKLLEQRLLRKLRFESGGVYSCAVSPFFGCEAPSWRGPIRGDVAVAFSCDPSSSMRLSQMVLTEVELLQQDGPERDEVSTILTVEERQHENEVQENQYWLEVIVQAYQSRRYQDVKNIDQVYKIREEARLAVFQAASPVTFRDALRRLLPHPCRSRYTLITMLPSRPLLRRVLLNGVVLAQSRLAQSLAVAGAVVVGLFVVLRLWARFR